MKVKIIETGEIKSLEYIYAETGRDEAQSLIGNFNGFIGYDREAGINTITEAGYEWWADLLPRYEAVFKKAYDYEQELKKHTDKKSFLDVLYNRLPNDLEDQINSIRSVIDEHKQQLEELNK